MLAKQLLAMARVARAQGDKASAADLRRVAQWARRFSGKFWRVPDIGPRVPFMAGEHARATGEALRRASERGADDLASMALAWRNGGAGNA